MKDIDSGKDEQILKPRVTQNTQNALFFFKSKQWQTLMLKLTQEGAFSVCGPGAEYYKSESRSALKEQLREGFVVKNGQVLWIDLV